MTEDTHLTQIASYFDIVDSAVKTADTNKRYTISTNVSTAPSPPIGENSWTHVHIAPTCDNMCDLYNSYIVAEMEVKLKVTTNSGTISKANCNNSPSVWVGFKDSLQATLSENFARAFFSRWKGKMTFINSGGGAPRTPPLCSQIKIA